MFGIHDNVLCLIARIIAKIAIKGNEYEYFNGKGQPKLTYLTGNNLSKIVLLA